MTDFSHCPDCSAPLGKERMKCRCGWVATQVQQVQQDPKHVPCAADHECRKPGRLWVDPYPLKARICVDHYYAHIDGDRRAKTA